MIYMFYTRHIWLICPIMFYMWHIMANIWPIMFYMWHIMANIWPVVFYTRHIMINIWPATFYTWHIMTNNAPIIFHIRLTVITYDFLRLQLPILTLLLPTRGVLWLTSSLLWPISSLLWPTYGVTASLSPIMVLLVTAPTDGRVENVVNWSRIFREGLRKTVNSSEYSAVNCNPIWNYCEQITPLVWISVTLSICFRYAAYCSECCSW